MGRTGGGTKAPIAYDADLNINPAVVNDQPWTCVTCTDCEIDPEAGSPGYFWR